MLGFKRYRKLRRFVGMALEILGLPFFTCTSGRFIVQAANFKCKMSQHLVATQWQYKGTKKLLKVIVSSLIFYTQTNFGDCMFG